MLLMADDGFNIRNAFVTLLLLLDRIVYSFVNYAYQVFIYLANFTFFTTEDYREIAYRIYIVIGVVALFLISFSLLQSLVNPDEIGKGKNSPVKVVKNVLISIVLLGVVPTVFNFAYDFQNRIMNSQVLSNIILNGSSLGGTKIDCTTGKIITTNSNADLKKVGNYMAVNVFSSFFTGNNDDIYGINIKSEDDPEYTLCEAYEDAKNNGDFIVFDEFVKNTRSDVSKENRVNYSMGVSLICGGIIFYLLLTFSIGLAVRAIKLAYYQLIAPIPILARIVPQGQKIFDNWLKGTLSAFAEVFIRLVVIFFAILMIQISVTKIDDILFNGPDADFLVLLLAKVLLIIGFLIFAKKAPEFITDMVGIKSGSLKLGIKDQIREAALIGKPIAAGMDKAQGLITGGLGAGWSYLKGSAFKRERPDGNVWDAVKYGAMTGVKSGGNQFSTGRDVEFSRETNKEGADSIWGAIDRRSKSYVADERKKARAAYDEIITQVESSPRFADAMSKVFATAMESDAVKSQMDEFVNNMKEQFVKGQFDAQKEANDNFLNELKSSPAFSMYKNAGMSDDEALRKTAEAHQATERLNEALDQTGELLRTRLGKEFDASQRTEAQKQFELQYRLDHESEIRRAASKMVQASDQLYKQAVAGHEAFVKSENQKDFKAVIEKMMKDEKSKGGGASSSKDNGKK